MLKLRKKLSSELCKVVNYKQQEFRLQCIINPYLYQQEILDNLHAEREMHEPIPASLLPKANKSIIL